MAYPNNADSAPSSISFFEYWLIKPKFLYFMLNLFVYGFHTLIYFLFVKQWHFTYYMYGYATLIIGMNFFGAMVWSMLADRTGRYKLIITATAILYTGVACGMLFFKGDGTKELTVGKTVLVFAGFGLFNFFLSAAFPLVDAMILGMLTRNPHVSRDQFGNQRMFGAIGHFTATLCSLVLYDKDDNRSVLIFQLVVTCLYILAVLIAVEDVTPVKHGHHAPEPSKIQNSSSTRLTSPSPGPPNDRIHQVPIMQSTDMAPTPAPPSAADELCAEGQGGHKHPIVTLITDANFMFFMVFVGCLGVVRAVTGSFQKAVALEIAKDDKLMTALVDFGKMFSEIFVYLIARYLKQAMGIYWILIFSQVMGIMRILGYGLIPMTSNYAYFAAWVLELMKGFSSGMVSSSAIPIASRIAPPGCENSAQGLFSGNYSGLSMALGGVISGGLLHMQYYPGCSMAAQGLHVQKMFVMVAIVCSTVTFMMTLKYIFIDRVMGLPGFPRRQSV